MNRNKEFSSNQFIHLILKEIPSCQIIPLPSRYGSRVVFNLKTKNVEIATKVFYKNNVQFTVLLDDDDENYIEADIVVVSVP